MKRIPISAAKRISTDYDCPEVVIFAYDPKNGDQHVTTYGRTLDQCKDAAKGRKPFEEASWVAGRIV
jgi:hypothetical protein